MPEYFNLNTGLVCRITTPRRHFSPPRTATGYIALFLAGFLMITSLSAVEPVPSTFVWDYSNAALTPEGWGGVKMAISDSVKTPDGKRVLEIVPDNNRDDQEWPGNLRYPLRAEMAKGAKEVEISFWIKGDADTIISLLLTSARWARYTAKQSYELNGEWQKIEFRGTISGTIGGKWLNAPRLIFEKTRSGQHFLIGPVTSRIVN